MNINKTPVIILGLPRTGSGVLSGHIALKYNLKKISEPTLNKEKTDVFLHHYNSNSKNYVVKVLIDQLDLLPQYRMLLNSPDTFKIKLTRDNKQEQIISHYISIVTGWYQYTKEQAPDNYNVKIDLPLIDQCINNIKLWDSLLDQQNFNYDLNMTYESLGILEVPSHVKSIQPNNFKILQKIVESKLHRA